MNDGFASQSSVLAEDARSEEIRSVVQRSLSADSRLLNLDIGDSCLMPMSMLDKAEFVQADIRSLLPPLRSNKGDDFRLPYFDGTFSLVFCLDVLERIHPSQIRTLCAEISRVTREKALIAMPYRQNLDVGRATCLSCGAVNPPYAHVNSFDLSSLDELFRSFDVEEQVFFGMYQWTTNPVSRMLLDFGGNPYGTYSQTEPCVHCGVRLIAPDMPRSLCQRLATRIATDINELQIKFMKQRPKFIHRLLKKTS